MPVTEVLGTVRWYYVASPNCCFRSSFPRTGRRALGTPHQHFLLLIYGFHPEEWFALSRSFPTSRSFRHAPVPGHHHDRSRLPECLSPSARSRASRRQSRHASLVGLCLILC